MAMNVKPFPQTRVRSLPEKVTSNIVYQILPQTNQAGLCEPLKLGQGRFAKVYKAWQRSDGQNIREVAIKILHDDASHADQDLFEQEVDLLKDLTVASRVNVVNTLDIVHLRPMIMCGCGEIYHPFCPQCGQHQLERRDPKDKQCPSLACPDPGCGYEISGEDIKMEAQYKKLLRPPAKVCPHCQEGARLKEGTIINFVDRQAVVMDLLEVRLDQFAQHRRTQVQKMCQQHSVAMPRPIPRTQSLVAKVRQRENNREERHRQKVMVLDKVLLMVQLAEAVAWLHTEMGIVHKDLTPDNIMVQFLGDQGSQGSWKGRDPLRFREVLDDMVSHPNFGVKVIDFGLSDRRKRSRKWYEEKDVNTAGIDKVPYFSPEALQRVRTSNNSTHPIEIDPAQKRFLIPPDLLSSNLSVHIGDILAFPWDRKHDHDLIIVKIETGQSDAGAYAYFEGDPPAPQPHGQYQMVHPLGEAHDIYSLGAVFYYILTEDHHKVEDLKNFVKLLQARPCELVPHELYKRDNYHFCRDHIPLSDNESKDKLMVLILRAMLRGQPRSFNDSRIDHGPRASQSLLRETKRLYREMQEEILAEQRIGRVERLAVAAAVITLLCGMTSGFLWGHARSAHGKTEVSLKP